MALRLYGGRSRQIIIIIALSVMGKPLPGVLLPADLANSCDGAINIYFTLFSASSSPGLVLTRFSVLSGKTA